MRGKNEDGKRKNERKRSGSECVMMGGRKRGAEKLGESSLRMGTRGGMKEWVKRRKE